MITETDIYQAELRRWQRDLTRHLDRIPELLHLLRERRIPLAAARLSERISGGGGEKPMPFREHEVDTADYLWAKLALYVGEIAEKLQDPAPGAVGASWATARGIEGLPAWTTPEDAHKAAWDLDAWVIERAEKVYALNLTDTERDLFGFIRRLWADLMEEQPEEREEYRGLCLKHDPITDTFRGCGERTVSVLWVDGEKGAAMCTECGEIYESEGQS